VSDLGDGDHTGRLGVPEHIGQTFSRVIWIEGEVGGAGFKDAEQADDHLGRARQGEDNEVFRSDAFTGEEVGEPVGLGIKLGIGQSALLKDQGSSLRAAFDRLTWASNRADRVVCGTSQAVSFHSTRIC
jgi:hypothetical protein